MEYLPNFILAIYALGVLAEALGFLLNRTWKGRASLWFLWAAWLIHGIYIGWWWTQAGRAPLSNQYESLLFLTWASVGLYGVFVFLSKESLTWMATWVSLTAAVSLGSASFLDSSIRPLVPALQSNWLLIHVSTTLLGYAAFLLAFVGGIILLVTGRKKKTKEIQEDRVDPFLYRSSMLGFWLLTLGIITGAVWANSAWGTYWSWDPKETWSFITWLFYAMAIHLRRTKNWRGTRFAWLAVGGFAFVIFTYFGVNYLLSGLHSYA